MRRGRGQDSEVEGSDDCHQHNPTTPTNSHQHGEGLNASVPSSFPLPHCSLQLTLSPPVVLPPPSLLLPAGHGRPQLRGQGGAGELGVRERKGGGTGEV